MSISLDTFIKIVKCEWKHSVAAHYARQLLPVFALDARKCVVGAEVSLSKESLLSSQLGGFQSELALQVAA